MALTTKQLKERKKYIGSSEAAALLGLSTWANAYDLWLEKTDQILPDESELEGVAADGLLFESGILWWASHNKRLGPLVTDPRKLSFKHPSIQLVSHPDAVVITTDEPVEVKTSGLRGPLPPGWGEPGTDQVPDYYIIQAQVHMLLTQKEVCHMPVYLGGRGPTMFQVKQNPSLQDLICERVFEFWDKFVKKNTPPPDVIPHIETAKRMIREPGKLVSVESGLVVAVRSLRKVAAEAKLTKEFAEAALMAALGDAEGTEDGVVTYLMQHRKAYPVPEADFRVLRLRKEKGQ